MLYFTSAPAPANQIPTEVMAGIKKLHGTYDEYNRKLRAAVNTEEDIRLFESTVSEEFLWSLYDVNITLYSSSKIAGIMSGTEHDMTIEDVGALATKVNGVAYIAVDTDPIQKAHDVGKGDDSRLAELVESVVEHELVHVLQMERGDLDFVEDGIMWKNRLYSNEFLTSGVSAAKKSNDPFAIMKQQVLLPWEVEAYAVSLMERNLKDLFKDDALKVMTKVRKQYLASINHSSRRA